MRPGGVLSPREEIKRLSTQGLRPRGALADRVAALIIKGSAFLAIISLILIFVFIGKEALPIFTSSEVHEEVDLRRLFLAQSVGEEATSYTWQPVSAVPKYSLLPLLVGTLKATIIAVLIAIPLAVAAALFTSDFALPWARE